MGNAFVKRDRDDTDFRAVRSSLEQRNGDCPFCTLPADRIVAENELAVAIRDAFPVTPLHTLVIPKRHEPGYFQLSTAETRACGLLLNVQQEELRRLDPDIAAFNIGVNEGPVAGQTVPHCHIHLIPRRKGDVENPRGGVRHVIPGKGIY
jgi:diadenosine tetraphosphate (Ap4A) HIT family hydrolase